MVELTDIQKKIRASLIIAISNNYPQKVQGIFDNNECDNIQAVLNHEGIGAGYKDNFLDFAIRGCPETSKFKHIPSLT